MQFEAPSSNSLLRRAPDSSEWFPPLVKRTKPQNTTMTGSSQQADIVNVDANHRRNESSRPKQNKSRNGCMTCKKKRIKCDEAKPTCGQCARRNLECDGYRPHYKWRSFDDTAKPPPGAGKFTNKQSNANQRCASTHEYAHLPTHATSSYLEDELSCSPGLQSQSVCTDASSSVPEFLSLAVDDELGNHQEQANRSQFDLLSDLEFGFDDSSVDIMPVLQISPGQSSSSHDTIAEEETIRNRTISAATESESLGWQGRASLPADLRNSFDPLQSMQCANSNSLYFDESSVEMLLLRFDKETCGVLSIKDGFNENPWRTFIRPLAKTCDALCHAISAMAALHGASSQPRLRLVGMMHMTNAVSKLSADMHKMSENQILASALALCIGEGWDDKISTGIKHLKGAKTVLNDALARRSRSVARRQFDREDLEPFRFLSNTYVYLDAIARLTSSEDHDNVNLDNAVQAMNHPVDSEIDPLMGGATTLFPLLGKVASLVHRIRKTGANSLNIISEANELREELLHWEPPDMYSFEQPRDPTSNVRHVLQTAEAYRRAILLHLHSAVTELSSEPSHDQAKATLAMLAATPVSSRTMIVQIFPLLVGSCEMIQPEDREWVAQRWHAMMQRLTLVNVSSCWKIVKEVWRRRDQWVETQPQRVRPAISRSMSSGPSLTRANCQTLVGPSSEENLGRSLQNSGDTIRDVSGHAGQRSPSCKELSSPSPKRGLVRLPRNHTDVSLLSGAVEYTVRGQLHWLGVMSDWNWEVFL